MSYAHPTDHDDTVSGSVRDTFLNARLAKRQGVLMGAILAPGQRTVSSALRAMGLDQHKRFHRYHMSHPTFCDALALVRKELWAQDTFCGSAADTETVKVPRAFMQRA